VYVQPYFPDQIEIPGNVASEAYDLRLQFIRRTVGAYFLFIVLIGLGSIVLPLYAPTSTLLLGVIVGLVMMGVIRFLGQGTRWEIPLSCLLLTAIGVLLSNIVRLGLESGIPVWSLGWAVLGACLYTLLCGRDFSFIGQFFLGALFTVFATAITCVWAALSFKVWLLGTGIALAYLFYLVYDLAALLTRRKRGDELGALCDLFRDVLNVGGYVFRVIAHWRNFRI